jgi:hypothetical protein
MDRARRRITPIALMISVTGTITPKFPGMHRQLQAASNFGVMVPVTEIISGSF